ncbi:MAG: ABC-2 family transporter protein [Chlamydiota bacterium]
MSKYLKVFSLSCHHTWRNKKALIGLSLFLIICLVIFANLWEVIARRGGLTTMDPQELLWYIALNQWILVAIPRTERAIERDFRTGKLTYLIPRPMSYLGYVFAEGCGQAFVYMAVLGVISYIFTWGFVGSITISGWGLVVVFVSGLFALILGIILKMIIGLLTFWMHDVDPVAWIFEKSLFALGGLLLPLSAYPPAWQAVAKYTPFSVILGGRSALALHYNAVIAFELLAQLLLWIILGGIIARLLYLRGLKIMSIGGG